MSTNTTPELKSSAQWQELTPYIRVLDPDGWDRRNFEKSWHEPITFEEYCHRRTLSTCSHSAAAKMVWKCLHCTNVYSNEEMSAREGSECDCGGPLSMQFAVEASVEEQPVLVESIKCCPRCGAQDVEHVCEAPPKPSNPLKEVVEKACEKIFKSEYIQDLYPSTTAGKTVVRTLIEQACLEHKQVKRLAPFLCCFLVGCAAPVVKQASRSATRAPAEAAAPVQRVLEVSSTAKGLFQDSADLVTWQDVVEGNSFTVLPTSERWFVRQQVLETQVTVTWDPTPDAVGYALVYGPASGDYWQMTTVGAVTSATFTAAVTTDKIFVCAWAIFADGSTTDFSNEAVWKVPGSVLTIKQKS